MKAVLFLWLSVAFGCGTTPFDGGTRLVVETPPANVPDSGSVPGAAPLCAVTECPQGFATCSTGDNTVTATLCGTDLTSDTLNCGACGSACGNLRDDFTGVLRPPLWAEAQCLNGQCTLACVDKDHRDCNTIKDDGCETYTQFDSNNCGACGVVCPEGTTCVEGACGCPSDKTICTAAGVPFCSDLTTDTRACGDCNTQCAYDSDCVGGHCICRAPGQVECGPPNFRVCTDTASDDANCGGCGVTCIIDDGWASSTKPNMHYVCVNSHCPGASFTATTMATLTLPAGARAPRAQPLPPDSFLRCNIGTLNCDGRLDNGCEVDLNVQADLQRNCGACGVACDPGVACVTINPGEDNQETRCGCPGGFEVCLVEAEYTCVRLSSDVANCGACGNVCPQPISDLNGGTNTSEGVCVGGTCQIRCAPSYEDCNGNLDDGCEVNTLKSQDNCGACGQACAPSQPCVDGTCLEGPCTQDIR